jgi:sugar lactone lactonase YvrE
MKSTTLLARAFACVAALASLNILAAASQAQQQLLVADRLSNSVYRYNASGQLLGTVLSDNVNLLGPSGIAVSPDQTKLFVTSSGNNRVVQYDYSVTTGAATNPVVFAAGAVNGIAFPSSVKFSQDGTKLYVSNLGGTGIKQYFLDGSSAGPTINGVIGGGAYFQFTGMDFAPSGELIVGAFQDFTGNPDPNAIGTSGAVAKTTGGVAALADFIPPSPSLLGASGILVNGNDLYVSSMFAGLVQRYNATTGVVDPSFGISQLAFPQALIPNQGGSGFLTGILGYQNGTGYIAEYGFNGLPVGDGVFASPGGGGFTEATALAWVAIPEPATCGMLTSALVALGFTMRRRRA